MRLWLKRLTRYGRLRIRPRVEAIFVENLNDRISQARGNAFCGLAGAKVPDEFGFQGDELSFVRAEEIGQESVGHL
jgi:hypothetical protein